MQPSRFNLIKIKRLYVKAIELSFQIMQFATNQKIKILPPLFKAIAVITFTTLNYLFS
jgi:hypothetical protein